ncbi:transcriptional attenuator, LytR family [Actinacidiphila alni]|uniref:Transcriptional attenuator, LytR family n=1 Tax=Actinacidiphila alni TaxID=380248 RepID=A0A1I2JUS4_9ACTN|nr:LCP family protein [Actinacidiphila alni]SFF56521.1 transcriptional attenuator, LytR family [Actinacidiphila alni]
MADGQDDHHDDDRTANDRPEIDRTARLPGRGESGEGGEGGDRDDSGGSPHGPGGGPDEVTGSGASAVAPRGGRTRRRRVLRMVALATSALVLLTAATATVLYLRLDGNIRNLPLFGGVGGDAGREVPDAFGRTPINVLVIGSDTRAEPEDCRLGGDCGPGQNADVGMVLHISADRSHASVLSIPRDTVTDLPACRDQDGEVTDAWRGPINATLRHGPGCTVAAVHALTKIPIDHFVMADFAGVVRMSDAIGGVPVCVNRDVYDSYSHLKLAKGRHELQGTSALEFLRSRHAFGDGSDLGRTDAQHLFLGALAGRLRENSSFTDPASLLSLADAATKALTVDPGLAAVHRLVGLANDLRKVPSSRIVFTTMPNVPDPDDTDRVVVSASGRRLFAAIAADLPLTVTAAPSPDDAAGETAADTAAPDGTGTSSDADVPSGSDSGTDSGYSSDSDSEYSSDADSEFSSDSDGANGSASPTATPSTAPTTPLTRTPGRTAATRTACAQVATEPAVTVRGETLTPSAAFRATPWIPVSAP